MNFLLASSLVLRLLLAGAPTPAPPAEDEVYPSNLMVDQEVNIACQVMGVIETIHVDRGTPVVKGQPLATLHMGEFDANVRETRENMELAKVQLDRAQALSAGNIMSKADLGERRAQFA